MSISQIRLRGKAFAALLACGVFAAVAILGIPGSASSGPTPLAGEPNAAFSVLGEDSGGAISALPEKARTWLKETEQSSLLPLEDRSLVALGTVDTAAGEVVVAQMGGNICAYSLEHGLSTCGEMSLIDEGKLFVVRPGCPSSVIIGVLPDGFTTVEVEATGTATSFDAAEAVPVESNVYIAEIATADTVLSGSGRSGQSFTAEAPLGQIGTSCQ